MTTIADLLAIPEEARVHELFEGRLVRIPTPSIAHRLAQSRLIACLQRFAEWQFLADVELPLSAATLVRPDIAGWSRVGRSRREHADSSIAPRPDWVCEIVSRPGASRDLVHKWRIYHRLQVQHYWLVDPVEETFEINRWHPEGYLLVAAGDRTERVRAEPFEAIELQVGVLFGDDPDDE